MLKLNYLFNNEDLAKMLIENWEYDKESIELFRSYRISSNAVYPFKFEGDTQFLRFAPAPEKSRENSLAELDFITYLRARGYGALEAVASENGEYFMEAETPWGRYYASVFKRVSGVQMNEVGDDIVFSYGKALGKLHQLSSEYTPDGCQRWTYRDVLAWIQEVLTDFPHETAALMEAERLKNYFSSIPMTKENFGLIHYDFEYDNVFYDEETGSCNVIDFDDSMYHWYAMDIDQALDSLAEYVPAENYNDKRTCFLNGYRTEFAISEDYSALIPACRRFAALYGYVRCLRSMAERWEHEPEWLVNLRAKLTKSMEKKASYFGNAKVNG
ncbi:phosphotransferase [Paenibacillus pasadenensis]|uniref:phosphotransferase enzyme family protein n=1 Tax=Paenibacillus pasadenensis TaxID=217090 RepID=UPI00203F42DE|nr:phosphotransferase [Paenibacillus pasadenensis]MCM3746087.1 phosphotransferase [Paenibacillus pasadenensis]